MAESLLVYVPEITPRIRYGIKTLLETFLQVKKFSFTTSLEDYLQYQEAKFSYSEKKIESGIHFHSSGLLEQKGINELELKVGQHEELVTLFQHDHSYSALPYDPFAAAFYMLSRYEEYLPHLKDKYDRFSSSDSVAKKHDFLQTAVVDRWAMQVKEVLSKAFPNLAFPERRFTFIPTIDIDNAYAYKYKGLIRILGSLIRSVLKFNIEELIVQFEVLAGKQKDPFDTYNYQLNMQKRYNLSPTYFFLLGDYGLNDKNLSHENRQLQNLIKHLADYARVGIHPSFGSNGRTGQLRKEIDRLNNIVKREITCSRQHYLKMSLPETYRTLIKEDILEDYTMGYADLPGFRAGTCTPYFFYDLDEELEVKLKVYPFQVMESTFKYYLNSSIDESIEHIEKIIKEIKEVQGTFVSLWHNESLSDSFEWKGWRKVYEKMLEATQ